MIEALHPVAAEIAEALKARGERIVVIDGATGGLVSAALLTVPGALSFYVGGGIVYSLRARKILLGGGREAFAGMVSATEDYALAQAHAARAQFGVAWALAETGAAGSSVHPMGVSSGRSCVAVVGPGVARTRVTETASDARIANMEAFTRAALSLLAECVRNGTS